MGGAGGIIVHRCVNSLYSLDSLAALMDRQRFSGSFVYSSRVKISHRSYGAVLEWEMGRTRISRAGTVS